MYSFCSTSFRPLNVFARAPARHAVAPMFSFYVVIFDKWYSVVEPVATYAAQYSFGFQYLRRSPVTRKLRFEHHLFRAGWTERLYIQ